ncbi:MAG TPA: radical SAM protein [Verrucomicrobiota bacterium]|nr:radical SAM protein [Verrucomicrobiota bacterium]HNU52784.1 radical SAM protein [Verrucomicrobiota bacterium]
MTTYLSTTQSTCRTCRRLIPAQLLIEDNCVWMRKQCPEHGPQQARVHGDAQAYLKLGHFHRKASVPLAFTTPAAGCPDSCGLCPDHEQHVCLPILEITDHCNWDCPICLVANPGSRHWTRDDVARVLDDLICTEGQIDVLNLSGGEPTLNPHFREIIEECAARREILRVSVSTNGSVLVRDRGLLQFLTDRRVIVSLQFDGASDDVYQALRGRPAIAEKHRLIALCSELNTPMSLTATVARGVNDHRVNEVADLLFRHDHILSAMFQPAAYAGRAAVIGRPADAVTIPDVIAALKGAGGDTVSPEDFSPLPCSHPACFSLAFYLHVGNRRYLPIRQLVNAGRYLDLIQNRALFGTDAESFDRITDAVYELWSGPAALSPDSQRALNAIRHLLASATAGGYSPHQAMTVAERAVKSIFIHQFMDPDTFDLSRARKCCQVYPQRDGRMLPVCVRNCR